MNLNSTNRFLVLLSFVLFSVNVKNQRERIQRSRMEKESLKLHRNLLKIRLRAQGEF